MASVADPLGLLRRVVADSLGPERVAELVDQARVRVFDAFLLRRAGAVPRREEYEPKVFTTRSGVDYFCPDGWVQVWLTQIDDDPDFVELRKWPVAYHGTDSRKLGPILEAGLRKPGELPSVQMAHGNAGAGPDGAIYTSPSLWLASHPAYSTFLDLGDGRWAQFVFKVRVRPGFYAEQASTLSNSEHWETGVRLDPNFPHNEALEWLVASSSDVKVVGLMIRELGTGVDSEVFGEVATQVAASPTQGPEYCWTAKIREAFRDADFTIDLGRLTVGTASVEWRLQDIKSRQKQYRRGALRSHAVRLPDFGIEGWLGMDFTSRVPRAWLYYRQRHNRQEPICFQWIEASCGLEACRIASPTTDDWALALLDCRPHDDQIVFVARWISTSTPVIPVSVSASTAWWTLRTSMLNMRGSVANTEILSPCIDLEDKSGLVHMRFAFLFSSGSHGNGGGCEVQIVFCDEPLRPVAYTVQLGEKTGDFVYSPGCRFVEVRASWAEARNGGLVHMRLTITGLA